VLAKIAIFFFMDWMGSQKEGHTLLYLKWDVEKIGLCMSFNLKIKVSMNKPVCLQLLPGLVRRGLQQDLRHVAVGKHRQLLAHKPGCEAFKSASSIAWRRKGC
jgi:hypothetical protein